MKLRVRINRQTSRVELLGEDPSLKELRDHIQEMLLSSHGLRSVLHMSNSVIWVVVYKVSVIWLPTCASVQTQSLVCLWTAPSCSRTLLRLWRPAASCPEIWSVSICLSLKPQLPPVQPAQPRLQAPPTQQPRALQTRGKASRPPSWPPLRYDVQLQQVVQVGWIGVWDISSLFPVHVWEVSLHRL